MKIGITRLSAPYISRPIWNWGGEKKIKWKILHNAGQPSVYIITLASNEKKLRDIIPSRELIQKGYPKKNLFVVGLAKGYDEAIEVAASIVDEVYRRTGTFAVRAYFDEKRRRKREECQSYCSY